jgi:hypothetical protein
MALRTIKRGISGQAIAIVTPITAAPAIKTTAATRENTRTKNPTVRETKLSSAARILSSSERPGGLTILFHGANKVLSNTGTEKDSCTLLTKLTAPLPAWRQPSPYHHWKNSRNNIALIVP